MKRDCVSCDETPTVKEATLESTILFVFRYCAMILSICGIHYLIFVVLSCLFQFLSWQYYSLVSSPFSLSPVNYRLCCGLSRNAFVRNKYMNMSIANEWRNYWKGSMEYHSNDSKVLFIRPSPIDSVLNQDVNICSSDTFLIMMFPIRKNDYQLRQLIRRAIPQGIVIEGKTINRLFVIALADHDREGYKRVREEKSNYGDIIISRHQDQYVSIPLSVWDGYIWIRDHCHSAVFAGKFDSDAVFLLGNLVSLLLQYPTKRFYGGGKPSLRTMEARKGNTTNVYSIPYDYPEKRRFTFTSGAVILLSLDSVDYLVTGVQYEPYFVCADDYMTGFILDRVGIQSIHMGTENCAFVILNKFDCGGKYMNRSLLPNCLVCYHGDKTLVDYNESLHFFGDRLYSTSLQERVNLSAKLRPKNCY